MACAAIDAAGMNVRINAALLDDKAAATRAVEELRTIQSQAAERIERILAEVEKRAAISINTIILSSLRLSPRRVERYVGIGHDQLERAAIRQIDDARIRQR